MFIIEILCHIINHIELYLFEKKITSAEVQVNNFLNKLRLQKKSRKKCFVIKYLIPDIHYVT